MRTFGVYTAEAQNRLKLTCIVVLYAAFFRASVSAAEPQLVFSVKSWDGDYASKDISGGVESTPSESSIYTVNADGGGLKKIVQLGKNSDYPTVSPDGRWVYFQSNATGDYQIYRCRWDGSDAKSLTPPKQLTERFKDQSPFEVKSAYGYALSADGEKMAFTVHDGSSGRVAIANSDGSSPSLVAPHLGYIYMAKLSPKNDRVVFSGPANGYRLLLAALPDGKPIDLTPEYPDCFVPQFTANGKTVIFVRRDGDIYRVDADGKNFRRLTEGNRYVEFKLSPKDRHGSTDGPDISPDGKCIAFVAVHDGVPNIFVMDLDGGGRRQVTTRKTPCGRVRWSPDGKELAFVSFEGKFPQLFVVPAKGGEPRQITKLDGAVYFVNWCSGEVAGKAQTDNHIAVVDRKTLSVDTIACQRIPVGAPGDYKPCVALLPTGELLLAAFHQHQQDGGKVREQNLLFRSKDDGRTWSKPEALDLLGREPYLTVLKDGTVFMTGHLLANDMRNKLGYTHGYVHRSTDAGKTWVSIRIESEGIKPKASNHSTRNILQLADGTLLLGVDYDGGGGPYFVWRSTDGGKTWDKTGKCEPKDFKSQYGFFGGETWLWQANSGKIWALVRVDSNEFPIKERPIKSKDDQSDHFILFASADGGKNFDRRQDFGNYGEMYMSILRLQDKRLLLTFTVRDLAPPLGVRAIPGIENEDGFEFDFAHDRVMVDAKTPLGKSQGGGFGPTVQLKDGTLVTSYSYRGDDNKTHLEVVRWQLPVASRDRSK